VRYHSKYQAGADINALNPANKSPLHLCAEQVLHPAFLG
jgi:hypothetical protein